MKQCKLPPVLTYGRYVQSSGLIAYGGPKAWPVSQLSKLASRRMYYFAVIVIVAIVGIGFLALSKGQPPVVSHGGPVKDYVSLIDNLRAVGTSVEPFGNASQDVFSVPRNLIKVNGETVSTWEFLDAYAAQTNAASVSADGNKICKQVFLGMQCSFYDWIDIPHWYARGRMIVLYVGHNTSVINTLEAVLGPEFAGR